MKAAETHKGEKKEGKANRLINETSTYLLQHAYNPVDWFPWGPEALEKSKAENKPILLSVGYAACHWCHVMEHESFEDEFTAKMMNEKFVNIKVDREERTDIDEIYMKAVQLMTGHGGWPMTVFLTPELKPFFGGTYFPKEPKHGMPAFTQLLEALSEAWKDRRNEVEETSGNVTEHLKKLDSLSARSEGKAEQAEPLKREVLLDAADRLLDIFDHIYGGFGNAPKFPHTFNINLSLRCIDHLTKSDSTRDAHTELVTTTLDKMAMGGINDQIGGGFARYSVDRKWLIPHFEKMLYDNALLCQTYIDGYRLLGRKYWLDTAESILSFVNRELKTEEGAFYSSLDADSEGEEGKFYVFTPAQFNEILGTADSAWACQVYGVTQTGNFEHGTSALHFSKSPEAMAADNDMNVDSFYNRLKPINEKLLAAREKRIRPGRDEKVLTSWNSLMISAFVSGYTATGKEIYIETARNCASFIMDKLMKDDRLLRTYGKGKAKLNGYLEDYAFFVQALLDLAGADLDPKWLIAAQKLTDVMLERFKDNEEGGLYFTSDDHEELVTRPRSHFDGAVPSGTSVAAANLAKLARLTDNKAYEKRAEELLLLYAPFFRKLPDQFGNLLCSADLFLNPDDDVAIIAKDRSDDLKEMIFAAHGSFRPNQLVVVSKPTDKFKLLEQRPTINDKPTAYICKNFTCQKPTNSAEDLLKKEDK
ncbi:MAG: thioredoxin domain-containing protein [Leptolyngbya sp.]|nr:thioredoxin domain-containing protein [Candidatus Melainabacteria bacterium]